MSSFPELTFFDYPLVYFNEIDSTSDYLKVNKINHPLMVVADYQTKGRGQYGRVWDSESGKNLTFSFQFFPEKLEIDHGFKISQMIALVLVEVLNEIIFPNRAYIKWPNDIIINDKKVAGILIETTIEKDKIEKVIVGIGININQKKKSKVLPYANSLANLFPEINWDRIDLLNMLIKRLELNIRKNFQGDFQSSYNQQLYKIYEVISILYKNQEIQVVNLGADQHGFWLLDNQSEKQKIQIKSSQEIIYLYK
ncbi:MAG: biotin--[acetyl-CoA-carboxylase] ligase [Chitinophagales bacterium]|nr:biotin--[acetyl-CoA-carboxylase] ligase [Chitinophagales bacterium]